MTTQVSQEAVLVAVTQDPTPTRVAQQSLLVAVTLAPDTSPTEASQLSLLVAVRRQGRRSITTSG